MAPSPRPKRVLFAGDFSAGKSTCLNIALRGAHAPVSVVSRRTDLARLRFTAAPVGAAPGFATAVTRDLAADGPFEAQAPDLTHWEMLELQLASAEDVTEERLTVLRDIDHVVWCTIGSQAWRLSEKSTFAAIRREYDGPATLAVTRADHFRSLVDRDKVERRLRHEAADAFGAVVFIAAPQVRDEDLADDAVWRGLGGDDLTAALGLGDLSWERWSLQERQAAPVAAAAPELAAMVAAPEAPAFVAAPEARAVAPAPEVEEAAAPTPADLGAPTPAAPEIGAALLAEIGALPGVMEVIAFNRATGDLACAAPAADPARAAAAAALLGPFGGDAADHVVLTATRSFTILMGVGGSPKFGVAVAFNRRHAVQEAVRRSLAALLTGAAGNSAAPPGGAPDAPM